MKLTLTFGAALSLAALAACSQSGQDNAAANADANAGMTASEGVLPIEDDVGNADTLGNQLDQLGNAGNAGNEAGNRASADGNESGNATNSY